MAPLFLILFAYINCRGTKESERFNTYLTTGKIVTLVIIITVAFSQFKIDNMKPFSNPNYGISGTLLGASMLFFGIVGFDFISMISEEAVNSKRDVPLAMRDSVLISTAFYVLVALSMCGMGLGRAKDFIPSTSIADQFTSVGLGYMTYLIYICALVGIAACNFTVFVGLVRLEQSLANEGFLPAFFSGSEEKNGISVKGTIFTTVIISFIAVFQSLEGISQLVSVVNLVTYSFVCACCIAYRFKKSEDLFSGGGASWVWIFFGCSYVSSMILMKLEQPIVFGLSLIVCLGAFIQIVRSKQWNKPDPEKGHYESPLVPYLPCFAIYVNFLLSWEPKLWVQVQMLLLTVIGLVIYFVYGVHNSKLN